MEKGLGFPDALPECDTIEETCQLWLDDLDAKGVEKAVFVTAGGLEQSNENMARIVQFAPDRFIGYAHHDPFAPGAAQKLNMPSPSRGCAALRSWGRPWIGRWMTNPLSAVAGCGKTSSSGFVPFRHYGSGRRHHGSYQYFA